MNKTEKIHSLVRDLQLSLEHLIILRDKNYVNWTVAAPGPWASGRVSGVYDAYTILGVIAAKIVEQMRPSGGLPRTMETTDVIFRYKGPVYIRPIGRGVVLSPGRQGGEFLDDVLSSVFGDGDYDMEIMFTAHPTEKERMTVTIKLSPTQVRVLAHMAKGYRLHCSAHTHPWLGGIALANPDSGVHTNAWSSLLRRGLIERKDTDTTPWYRRDYVITSVGREALPEQAVLEGME